MGFCYEQSFKSADKIIGNRYKLFGYYLLEQNQNKSSGLMLDKSEMWYTQKETSFSL